VKAKITLVGTMFAGGGSRAAASVLTLCVLTACASDPDIDGTGGTLTESRGALADHLRPASAFELARLISPDPLPAPVALPLPDDDPDALRNAYRSDIVGMAGFERVFVRVDGNAPVRGGTMLDLTVVGTPRTRRVFAAEGCKRGNGTYAVGATALAHLSASDGSSLSDEGRVAHGLLGGALAGMVPARALSAGVFEVSFPWGSEIVSAVELGGAP
jgi:hypothetical protein